MLHDDGSTCLRVVTDGHSWYIVINCILMVIDAIDNDGSNMLVSSRA